MSTPQCAPHAQEGNQCKQSPSRAGGVNWVKDLERACHCARLMPRRCAAGLHEDRPALLGLVDIKQVHLQTQLAVVRRSGAHATVPATVTVSAEQSVAEARLAPGGAQHAKCCAAPAGKGMASN